jgi:hypothetical protein
VVSLPSGDGHITCHLQTRLRKIVAAKRNAMSALRLAWLFNTVLSACRAILIAIVPAIALP